MSAVQFDRVSTGSLPGAAGALCCSAEGQAHPWLLGFLKNLTQRVVAERQRNAVLTAELSIIYGRLSKLEARQHDA